MKLNPNNAGLDAEKIAATYLQSHGLNVIAANFHCKYGEIDLIMQEKQTIVFIEVRLRSNPRFGSAAASITPSKQQKIIKTAQFFLQQHRYDKPCRFDAILLSKTNNSEIEWIRNAFET